MIDTAVVNTYVELYPWAWRRLRTPDYLNSAGALSARRELCINQLIKSKTKCT